MSVEASRYYRAFLGQLDESTQRIFQAWAGSQRHGHVLVKDDNGTVVLYADREEVRQKKSHTQALRTTIKNWQIPVQPPAGYLRLLSEAEFRAAVKSLPSQPPFAEPAAIESDASIDPPHPVICNMETLPSLSPGFDDRAKAMLMKLR